MFDWAARPYEGEIALSMNKHVIVHTYVKGYDGFSLIVEAGSALGIDI